MVDATVFQALFQAYPDALLVVNPAGHIVLANPSAATLLGYTTTELTELNVDALVPNSIRPSHAAHRQAYMQAPRARPMGAQIELVALRKGGEEVMVEIALSPLPLNDMTAHASSNEPLVVVAIRGIGAYPRVKQALKRARYSEQLAHLGRIAVDARDPQVVLDQAPLIAAHALQVEAARIFLLDSDRVALRVASGMGMVSGEEVGADVPHWMGTYLGWVLTHGKPLIVSNKHTEKTWTVPAGWVSALAVPLSDRGRAIGALCVCSSSTYRFDDDEIRFLESIANLVATSLQRAQSEEALNHAQRLESVGQLTGGIAHDFNNLLTVIQGNLQVLEDLPALAQHPYGLQLVSAAARASRRGAELTHKLLAFSRRQTLNPIAVNVAALLHSLSDMLRRTFDQCIAIDMSVQADCPPALVDPGQLESALLNIAINARDAMPEGGSLRFHAWACQTLPADLRPEWLQSSRPSHGFIAIAITDTGSGMSDEVQERAFEPFFTTKEVGRGTGLGLSSVYGFVKQSRGAMAVDSQLGRGTTITLYIPQPHQAVTVKDEDHAHLQVLPPGFSVLLVEDDAEVAATVSTLLETLHCQVRLCSSGSQALQELDQPYPFDLLLTDIALGPGMRGTELATLAQARWPQMAVLLTSGYSKELLDAASRTPTSLELLRKPYSRDELACAIANALAARRTA